MKPQLIDINFPGTRTIRIKKVDKFYLDAPLHFHNFCELVWVEKSFGKRIVGDHIDNFEDGDLVLMGPNLPHIWQNDEQFYGKRKGVRATATVIYFPVEFLINLSDEQNIIQPTQELINRSARGLKFKGITNQKVAHILSTISEKAGLKKIIQFLEAIEILSQSKEYEYLASVSFKNLYDEKDTNRINTIYNFLVRNFHRDIHLEEVASLCNMSPNAFCRFFKSRSQKSLTQFLNELRVGHACKLLQNEDYSVSDVCYECGYNNLANFNKFFKQITFKTPSEYRKNIKHH
jgi:AraC-like DNA-binding protein